MPFNQFPMHKMAFQRAISVFLVSASVEVVPSTEVALPRTARRGRRPSPRPEKRPSPRPERRSSPLPDCRPSSEPEPRPSPPMERCPFPILENRPSPRMERRPCPVSASIPSPLEDQRNSPLPNRRPIQIIDCRPSPIPERRRSPRPDRHSSSRPDRRSSPVPAYRPSSRPDRRPSLESILEPSFFDVWYESRTKHSERMRATMNGNLSERLPARSIPISPEQTLQYSPDMTPVASEGNTPRPPRPIPNIQYDSSTGGIQGTRRSGLNSSPGDNSPESRESLECTIKSRPFDAIVDVLGLNPSELTVTQCGYELKIVGKRTSTTCNSLHHATVAHEWRLPSGFVFMHTTVTMQQDGRVRVLSTQFTKRAEVQPSSHGVPLCFDSDLTACSQQSIFHASEDAFSIY